MSLLAICPDGAGEGDCTVEPAGEKTEPLTLSATGVEAPDWLGDAVGRVRVVVDEKRLEREALLRRYGSDEMLERGSFPRRLLWTEIPSSRGISHAEKEDTTARVWSEWRSQAH